MKMSKKALIKKLFKSLKVMSKKELAVMCYQMQKSKLPRLESRPIPSVAEYEREAALMRKTAQTDFKKLYDELREERKRKTKTKFTKKQLAAQKLFAKRSKDGTLRKMRSGR